MRINVALTKEAVSYGQYGTPYIDEETPDTDGFEFDENVAKKLDQDDFLNEMWSKFGAVFDWGDCDYFPANLCVPLITWLEDRLQRELPVEVRDFYEKLLEFARIAVSADSGIAFYF